MAIFFLDNLKNEVKKDFTFFMLGMTLGGYLGYYLSDYLREKYSPQIVAVQESSLEGKLK